MMKGLLLAVSLLASGLVAGGTLECAFVEPKNVGRKTDVLLVLGDGGDEGAAAREFAAAHAMLVVSPKCPDGVPWTDPKAMAELKELVDDVLAKHPSGRVFVCGAGAGGTGALAYAGGDSLRVRGVTAFNPKIEKCVTDRIPVYLMPVSVTIGGADAENAPTAAREFVSTLRFWHPGAIYVDDDPGRGAGTDSVVAKKALEEMFFRAELVGDGTPWRERHKTGKRYLQGPLSERMLVFSREGKIVFGEVEHEHDWTKKYEDLVSHGLWLADVKGDVMDFSAAVLSRRDDGVPIHSQTWSDNGLRIELEGCSPFGRRESAHLRLRIVNESGRAEAYRGAFFVRTAAEKRLLFDAPDNYQLFIPRENTWLKLPVSWMASDDGCLCDGDRFVSFAGDVGCAFDRSAGRLDLSAELKPGETRRLDLVLGRGKAEAPDYETVRARTEKAWKGELARLEDVFRKRDLSAWPQAQAYIRNFTSLMLQCFARPTKGDFVLPRQGGLQRYVWPGDQINVSNALGLLGYHEYVEMACDFYFGEYASASGEIGPFANGWANDTASVIDTFATYCRNYGKRDYWKKHRDAAVRAFRWMKALRAESSKDGKQYPGLYPARKSTDWPFVLQDWTFTDCANLAAMEHFAACAEAMDDPVAWEVAKEAQSYRRVIAGIIDRCRKNCEGKDELRLPLEPRDEHPEWVTNRLCYTFVYAYAASTGLLDEKDLLRMRRFMLRRGYASEEGGYSRLTIKRDEWFEHVWYFTWAEQEWVRAWLGVGRRDLARQALDACLRHIVSDEYVVCESASAKTPWWSPWSPNASGCGRLIAMMFMIGDSGKKGK